MPPITFHSGSFIQLICENLTQINRGVKTVFVEISQWQKSERYGTYNTVYYEKRSSVNIGTIGFTVLEKVGTAHRTVRYETVFILVLKKFLPYS